VKYCLKCDFILQKCRFYWLQEMRNKMAGGYFSNRYFCRWNSLGERHFATRHNWRSDDRAWLDTAPIDRAHKICKSLAGA